MSLAKRNKHHNDTETIEEVTCDKHHNEIHIFDGNNGHAEIRKLDMSIWLSTGEQYCPRCHIQAEYIDGYYQCGSCGWRITDDEALRTGGYPSLEATYSENQAIF